MSSRPSRDRKPSAAIKFVQEQEAKWEEKQAELARTAGERRRARKERERAKAQEEKEKEKAKRAAQRARERERVRAKKASASGRKSQAKKKGAKKGAKTGPKKPMSAFMYFSTENREDIKAENPDASFGEIARIIGNEWRALSAEDREYYENQAAADKRRYQAELGTAGAAPAAGGAPKAAKAAKATKKKAAPKKKAPKKTDKAPSSYLEFCAEAIGALRSRTGSSYQAIEKYITANHTELEFRRHHFRAALKRGVERGDFIKAKASFKLSPAMKKIWYR